MEEISAYHEAGHAFAAVVAGGIVDSVSIDPDWDDGPARSGDTQIRWDTTEFTERQFAEKQIMVALAGPVAEMVHTGDPFHPALVAEWQGDWIQAKEASAGFFKTAAQQQAFLERTTIELHQIFSRDETWAYVAAIVDELLAHETLEGDRVHEIVSQWFRLSQA